MQYQMDDGLNQRGPGWEAPLYVPGDIKTCKGESAKAPHRPHYPIDAGCPLDGALAAATLASILSPVDSSGNRTELYFVFVCMLWAKHVLQSGGQFPHAADGISESLRILL